MTCDQCTANCEFARRGPGLTAWRLTVRKLTVCVTKVAAALQERNHDLSHALLSFFQRPVCIYDRDPLRLSLRKLQICFAHAQVKIVVFRVQPIAMRRAVAPTARTGSRVGNRQIE